MQNANHKSTLPIATALLLFAPLLRAQAPTPRDGFIPNEETAITIAEAILSPIYGKTQIAGERPFHAQLNRDVWTVSGSLPPNFDGGVATIRLDKNTGRVLSYIHGK